MIGNEQIRIRSRHKLPNICNVQVNNKILGSHNYDIDNVCSLFFSLYISFHCRDVKFLVSLIAIDTDGAALVVSKIAVIRTVVALDIIFAILESLMPAFSIAGVVVVKDDIES